MGRAPCCEKMGLKRGPWTPEEDRILVGYIQRHGHENWRALPKQAGLLRCGKSCRLRWINYLRPDIKRGNFTKEEEEAIIKLHEMLGNRWSAIAARLPGRTDNEIKNVWHTHLKKRLNPKQNTNHVHQDATDESNSMTMQQNNQNTASPARSCSGVSSSSHTSSVVMERSSGDVSCMESWREFPEIEESFWSEALSMDATSPTTVGSSTSAGSVAPSGTGLGDLCHSISSSEAEDDWSFWLRVLMETGDVQELPGMDMS